MRVVLSPIRDARAMQCDDLMSKDVVPCGDRRRYSHSPAVVRCSQLICGPVAGLTCSSRVTQQTSGIDFVEPQSCFVNITAWAVAIGEVIENRSMMGYWPWRPLQLYCLPCRYFRRYGTRRTSNMANDIGIIVRSWIYRAIRGIAWDRPAG